MPPEEPGRHIERERLRGFNLLVGYRLVEWREDFARLELELDERHLNRSGLVHGGVLATMLDVTLGYAGIYAAEPAPPRRAVTLTMTTSYIGQARSGTLTCLGQRRGGGRTVFMATGEVRDGAGNLIALGEGTFRYIAEPR